MTKTFSENMRHGHFFSLVLCSNAFIYFFLFQNITLIQEDDVPVNKYTKKSIVNKSAAAYNLVSL